MDRKFYSIIIFILGLLTIYDISHAKYKAQEVLILPWGNSDKELFITNPVYDPDSLPQDSIVLLPADGPDLAVVDLQDNIIFGTTSSATIQAFDRAGNQVWALFYDSPYMDYADSSDENSGAKDNEVKYTESEIGAPFRCVGLANICVDSKSRLYIESARDQDYIAIVGLDGILLEKIYPPDFGFDINLQDMTGNSNDVLTFVDDFFYDAYTYRDGRLCQGGLAGWLAKDGYYYTAIINIDKHNIDFSILGDPETPSLTNAFRMESRPIQSPADFCSVMGVSDDMRIFVSSNTDEEKTGQLIQVYNANLDLIDQFRLKRNLPNRFQLSAPLPYFRPDGVIFEFQCGKDAMHIIKWTNGR